MQKEQRTLYELALELLKAKIKGWDDTSIWFEINSLLHSTFDEQSATYLYRVLRRSEVYEQRLAKLEEEIKVLKEENRRLKELLGLRT